MYDRQQLLEYLRSRQDYGSRVLPLLRLLKDRLISESVGEERLICILSDDDVGTFLLLEYLSKSSTDCSCSDTR